MEYTASILIVDSNKLWQELYKEILISWNYRIVVASSYEEARRISDIESFDVAVVEVCLDETDTENIDGWRFIEQIHNSGKSTSVIIVSRFLTYEIAKRAITQYRVFDLFEKHSLSKQSFDIVNFKKVVDDAIQKSCKERERIFFTSYHPKEGKINTWYTLLVYIHLFSAIEQVDQDAKLFQEKLASSLEVSSSTSTKLVRGTEVTVIPTCEGITFNPAQMTIKWLEDYHCANFRFCADTSLLDDAAKGYITFFVGPLIVGTLKFAMLFNSGKDVPLLNQEDSSQMGQDKIFISYSHKDTDIVLTFKKVHEATGYDVLIDIDDLHSGQEWKPELMHLIDRADIFQLFWSENSKQSKYCKQEWKYALKRNAKGFIRPVYWQKPMPNPPKELSKYHFEYVDL